MVRILIVDGNTKDLTPIDADGNLAGAAENYAQKLGQFATQASFEMCRPHFDSFDISTLDLSDYQGFAFTGSAVPWSASDKDAAPARAVMSAALATGKPVLGSCYGMQLGIAALGGAASANPKGAELAIAPDILLSEAGKIHALFAGKPNGFDALCMHRDVISELPFGGVVLAGNAHTSIQAMAIETKDICFWGVQYHPELEFGDIATYLTQTDGNDFAQTANLARHIGVAELSANEAVADFNTLQAQAVLNGSGAQELIQKYRLNETILNRDIHEVELQNWMQLVISQAK